MNKPRNYFQELLTCTNARGTLLTVVLVAFFLSSCASSGTALLNVAAKTKDYSAIKNISYGTHRLNKLDIYRPVLPSNATKTGTGKTPVVVFFYGGCWGECTTLEKSHYLFVAQSFASRGYVTVIANFRQYPEVKFDSVMQDASQVVHWVAEHIGEYGGDANRMVLAGHSSGAHIAAMLALNTAYLSRPDRNRVRGFIGLAGPYDFLPLTDAYQRELFSPENDYAASQPINFISSQSPPLLLLHGGKDDTVFRHNAVNLAQKAQRLGVPHRLVIYPEHNHVGILVAWSRAFQGRSAVLTDSLNFIRQQTR